MKWRVVVELSGAAGAVQVHEVYAGGSTVPGCSAATLGLTLADAKAVLSGVQRHLVQAQTEEHCQARRGCSHCGGQRPLKDRRSRRLRSLRGSIVAPASAPAAEAKTITLAIDSGHVRAVRSYQVRTFEVIVAQASNDDGKQIAFSSVPVEAA